MENEYVSSQGDSSLAGKDLSGTDLRHRDLSDFILFQTDLRGANLYGCKFKASCEQFDGVKLDDETVAKLLLMIQMADISPKWQVGLRDLVRRTTGDNFFRALQRWLKLA